MGLILLAKRNLEKKLQIQGKEKGIILDVDRRDNLSENEFVKKYLNKNLPVIFNGQANDWVCTKNWNLDYLKENYGDLKIALFESKGLVEKEHDHTNGSNEPVISEEILVSEFVDKIKNGEKKYMRFSPLMEFERALIKDLNHVWLKKFRKCFMGVGYQTFIGASDRITPIHAGTTAFFYIMADGEKKWTLFSASSSVMVGAIPGGRVYNFSDVDINNPNLNKYPGFDLLTKYSCHLKKGDILFVPTWMWHEVENLTESWGVSYRITSLRGFLSYPGMVFVRLFLSRPNFFVILYNAIFSKATSKEDSTTIITPRIYMDD
jgi:lysine-specific demethylase 8